MLLKPDDFAQLRQQFPALQQQVNGRPVVFLDGPAGTQTPQRVIDAVSHYLAHTNANHGGQFAASRESDEVLDKARRAMADLLGADDPDCIVFGPNMTTLTFALSRALAKTWKKGDEVVVTRLDHDANFTPWIKAVEDAGATVRVVNINPEDGSLDLDDFRLKITDRTRLVAVGCASNAVGTINPVRRICSWARDVGALTFLDAVHYAPHAPIDVRRWGCDFLVCSAYKFFGPHVGVLWGRRKLLEKLPAYKVRPAPNNLPDKWMTGTQNHEGIAGVLAALEYLEEIGKHAYAKAPENPAMQALRAPHASRFSPPRHPLLQLAMSEIQLYESHLFTPLLAGLHECESVTLHGFDLAAGEWNRTPTLSFTHKRLRPMEVARRLGEQGIFVWHGNYYALNLSEALGCEPDGMVRLGLAHYNTLEEVERVVKAISQL